MSYKVGSSALKGVGGGSGSTTSSKRLNTKIINKTKGKAAAGASDPDLRLTEEPDVQLVPPSSPVPTEELVQDLAELRLPPADPEDDDLEDSEDCEEEEEGVSCSDDVEEEEEEDDDDENYEEEDDDEEEEQEDRTRPAIAAAAPLPRKPLPQHRPQLPISQRASKRQGRASGISIVGTSASKKARAGIRKNVSGTATCSNVSSGNCKSIVSSLRKNPRGRPYNPQPIFVPNSSSDDDEIEEDDEALEDEEEDEDGGDEYLEGDGSEDDDDEDPLEPPGFLLPADGDPNGIQGIPPDAQARLEAFFEAAGFTDGKLMSDPESLRKLTLTVSSALGEASAAINRMRDSQSRKSVEDGRNDSMEEGDSLLALACSSGYYELARVLLAMGAAVDDRGSKGDLTPLMDAASQGHVEIVKLLLGHGADINAQSACGNSALMYSCSAGHDAVVLELLRGGANVEDNNENGHTPLMEAASAGHVGVAKLLLEHGAGINTHSNEFKESALTVACYKGHLDMVRYLLEAGADQQHKTDEMHTALMEASMDGHVEVARLLLDSGAQVNMPADSFESPLTLAACGGHVELAELLLERGANIEEVNDEGYTPLMEAAREGHHCVVRALIKAGASINAQTDETHETALTLAACGGFLDVVDTLCKSGADIELGGSTPLMEASQEGHLQVVKYMLERGSDINRQTQSGDTALSFASENGHLEVCQLLVEMGSDPEHAADGGRTPLMKACRGGHTEVIKFLLEKKADVNRHTATNDHTPLSLACAGGHLASVEVLLAAGANPYHKLKDNSTMIIEAARGGHTPVIRCLLDHAPCTHGKAQPVGAKGQAAAKQGQVAKGAAVAQNQKTTDAKGNTAQVRAQQAAAASMLRKSRSTSTLDSTAPQQPQTKEAPTVADTKVKAKPQVQAVVETQVAKAPASAVAPLVDTVKVEPTEAVQSAAPKAVPATSTTTPALSTTATAKKAGSSDGAGLVKRTGAEPAFAPTPLSPQSPSVTNDSITAGTVTTTSGTTFNAVPVGPPLAPLVPSQVTADTAISERPKAKANKPSARKQVQLQQQLQQLQQQVGQAPTTPSQSRGTSSCETSPGSSSDKSQITPTSSPLVSPIPLSSAAAQLTATPGVKVTLSTQPGPPGSITAAVQQHVLNMANVGGVGCIATSHVKLDEKQLSQIFSQHQQYYGKKDGIGMPIGGKTSASITIGPPIPSSSVGNFTNASTTVVVTHGNGETKTFFEGDKLPPGANETILSAAAAAFPIDGFPIPASITLNQKGELVQYQMAGSGAQIPNFIGASTLTTAVQTTLTHAAAGALNNFQPQIILPHPPPLPQCIAAAAAAAGIITPSGAPPPGALKGHGIATGSGIAPKKEPHAPAQKPAPALANKATLTAQAPIAVNQVPPVASLAAPVGQKKQLAKRSRPFGQPTCTGSNPRQANQQTQTHTHTHSHSHATAVGTKQNQSASTQTTLTGQQAEKAVAAATKHFDVNCSTESNGESSLSIAAAAGHYEVVEFLLSRNARIEHRDKKGCTPLILAADGGHEKIVELLLNHNADIEAQSERTKDTALSLACTKGRFEVVELLVKRGANKEHRNVSDYTPLSLAASGGYVNIIKHLLSNGAEINSRTGSKLGISPLMLAAMNGNTAAVKLLLDSGSDINAQIETNKNTALTLACFQGRQEVVSLLLDRKANLEHRAKTGLTPLMEAANGGYTDVGKILIDRGADVNAPPVPATKDTALTIAADKGHFRFVELLLQKHAIVEVRNKKGCTPLWLACHGGHLDVAQILFKHRADLDVQDNRRVSCLMAAFRKGHVKVIRWIVKNVQQFPSDGEMLRYYASIQGEPELLKKCQQCGEFIKQAKDKQALEANKNASILLEELDMERSREESKRQAAARRREKKKKKKQEKKVVPSGEDDDDDEQDEDEEEVNVADSGIDANSLGSNSSGDRTQSDANRKNNKENLSSGKPEETQEPGPSTTTSSKSRKKKNRRDRDKQIQLNPVEPSIYEEKSQEKEHNIPATKEILREKENKIVEDDLLKSESKTQAKKEKKAKKDLVEEVKKAEEPQLPTAGKGTTAVAPAATPGPKKVAKTIPGESTKDLLPGPLMAIPIHPASHSRKNAASFDTHETVASTAAAPHSHTHMVAPTSSSSSAKTGTTLPSPASQLGKGGRKDDGWKEVTRSCPSSRSKKVIVPSSVISRVIGRGGCNINAIREATGAHIEVEKQQKGQSQPERTIQIKGTVESTKQAHTLITALMNEPDLDVKKLLPASGSSAPAATSFTGIFSATTVATTMTTVRASGTPVTSASGSSSAPMIDSNPFTTFVAVPTASGKANVGKSQKAPASPPVVHSVSPPVQKPSTPVNGNLAPFKGTTATTQINKKNTVFFTPSKNSVNNIQSSPSSVPSSTFTSTKLTQQPSNSSSVTSYSQYQNQPNRTTTPTKAVTPTFGSSPPTATPPPIPSSPTGQLNVGQSQHKGVGYMVPNSAMPSTAQGQTFTPSLAPMGPIINPSQQILNRAPGNQNGPQHYGSVTLQQSAPVSSNQAQTLNLSPGNNTANVLAPIGSARPGAATVSAESSEPTNIPPTQPLEYSPFSYTFSQTSWLPDEDSQNNAGSNYQQSGVSSNSSLNMNPLLSGSSVARAMNFASVAASGISSSTITTATAQITGGLHNGTGGGLAGNVGLGIGNTANNLSNKGIPEPLLESEMPKADASKAPGYRGTNMGSPVLRMNMHQQPQQQQHISSGFGLETFSQSSGVGGLSQGSNPNNMMGGFNNTQTGRHVSLNMNSQIGVGPTQNWGTALGPDMGPGIIPQQPSSNNPMGFPNNNRLNPRAPSFSLPQYSKMGPSGQQQPSVSAYQQQQQQQQQFSSIHQHQQPPQHNMPGGYKVNSFGPGPRNNNNITSGPRPGVGSGMNVTGGWNSYSNEAVDLSGLAVLAGATGTLDPAIFGQIESSMQDNQNIMSEDRRLPRPIGGERASKNNAGSGFGVGLNNMAPFSALDCLDSNQLPQPISIQQQQQPPHHGQGGNSWMGSGSMYGITNPPYQGNNQQTHSQHSNVNSIHGPHTQPRGNDTRNFLGRRFMEELDPASRMLELQQMFDGPRMMNGGPGTGLNNLGPGLLHLGGLAQQPIFPFGPGGDHLDQQHGPKLDQHNNSWDSHLHMDDKHNMGWGAKWSN